VTGITAALSSKPVNLYSDLLLHKMGRGLTDGVMQGYAAGDEFRTAPLWGLGQRMFSFTTGEQFAFRGNGTRRFRFRGKRGDCRIQRLADDRKEDLFRLLRSPLFEPPARHI
jgi:hypothetical protein